LSEENTDRRGMNLKSGFESLQSISQVLSSENQKLLKIIPEQKPESLKEPETATGGKRTRHWDDIPRLKAEDLRFLDRIKRMLISGCPSPAA